jgi:hypothetical protein
MQAAVAEDLMNFVIQVELILQAEQAAVELVAGLLQAKTALTELPILAAVAAVVMDQLAQFLELVVLVL